VEHGLVMYVCDARFPCLLESPGILKIKYPGPGKSTENDFGPGKSWKFKLQFLESPYICWYADAMMQKYSRPHTSRPW